MAVADTYAIKRYSGNDVTTEFPITWPFAADADIVAVQVDDSTLVETTLTLTTDYTLVGAGTGTGTLTLVDALATGQTLVIYRDEAGKQTRSFVDGVAPPMAEVTEALDQLTRQCQQLEERIGRALLYAPTVNIKDKNFPVAAEGNFLVWDASGGFDNSNAIDLTTFGASTGYERFVATDAQTLFTLTEFTYVVGARNLVVYRNGMLIDTADLTESSVSTFTLDPCVEGDVIEARSVIMDAAADLSSATVICQASEVAALASQLAAAASALAAATSASSASTSETNAAASEIAAQAARVAAEAAAAIATASTEAAVERVLRKHMLI